MGDETARLDALLREAESVSEGTRALFLSTERVVALGFSIAALAATIGLVQDRREILMAAPFALLGALAYGVHLWSEMIFMGGYRRYLEEGINQILGTPTIVWESQIVPSLRRGPTADGLLLAWVSVGGVIGSGGLGLHAAWVSFGLVGLLVAGALLLTTFALFTVAALRIAKASDVAYKIAKAAESPGPTDH